MAIAVDKCIAKGRAGSAGATKFVWCYVKDSEAILVFSGGILKGITGNAPFDEVEKLATNIGKSATAMGIKIPM